MLILIPQPGVTSRRLCRPVAKDKIKPAGVAWEAWRSCCTHRPGSSCPAEPGSPAARTTPAEPNGEPHLPSRQDRLRKALSSRVRRFARSPVSRDHAAQRLLIVVPQIGREDDLKRSLRLRVIARAIADRLRERANVNGAGSPDPSGARRSIAR